MGKLIRRYAVVPVLKVIIALQVHRVDAVFARRQGLAQTRLQRLLAYPAVGWERFSRTILAERQDLIFRRYVDLHLRHYEQGGRGYLSLPAMTPEQLRELYLSQTSRVASFEETLSVLLDYVDGDTFLELGCGTGQNIRWLVSSYPHSAVLGADLSEDAIDLVREYEPSELVSLRVGDITDFVFLDALLERPVDHIIMAHVFSLVLGSSKIETIALRQAIVDRLVAASRKSVAIMDSFAASGTTTIKIEQLQRAVVSDDVLKYFSAQTSGMTALVTSPATQAVMHRKRFYANGNSNSP